MNSPNVTFHELGSWRSFHKVRSNNQEIRFRVWTKDQCTVVDADWWGTDLELAPEAWAAISSYVSALATEWGGGKSCVVVRTKPKYAATIEQFIKGILSNALAWRFWDPVRGRFVPLRIGDIS